MIEINVNVTLHPGEGWKNVLSVFGQKMEERTAEKAVAQKVAKATVKDAPAKPEKPKEAPKAEQEITEVRRAMNECRARIEGADWTENTESESYVKYHKPLTRLFKSYARTLGSDVPSQLPEDKIQEFVEMVGGTYVDKDGVLIEYPM